MRSALKAFWLAAFFISASAHAQTPPKSISGSIEEGYSSDVVTAGSVVVGVLRGAVRPTSDINSFSVRLKPAAKASDLCFRAGSRDGEWWARGRLKVAAKAAGPLPINQAHAWQFQDQLKAYAAGDIAALARFGADCETNRNAPLVPIVVGDDASALAVMINSQNALDLHVSITLDQGQIVQATCSRTQGRSLHYNNVCTFNLGTAPLPEKLVLEVARTPAVGPQRVDRHDMLMAWQ